MQSKYLLSIIFVYCLYVVLIGGDHMAAHRMLVPILLPLIYVLFLAMQPALEKMGSGSTLTTLAVALVLSAVQLFSQYLNPRAEDPAARVGAVVGKYIDASWPADSLIALHTAGSTPYYAPGHRFIDMLGLNDARIARRQVKEIVAPLQEMPGHMKGDGAYVLSRRPDYIILGTAMGTVDWAPLFLSDVEIAQDPRFAVAYRPRQVWLDATGHAAGAGPEMIAFTFYVRQQPPKNGNSHGNDNNDSRTAKTPRTPRESNGNSNGHGTIRRFRRLRR